MPTKKISFFLYFICLYTFCIAQNVPILSSSLNPFGQVQLEIEAQADKYYLLTAQHEPDLMYESITSITMGVDGTMFISEPAAAFPLQNYTITEHSIANPNDTDGDGIDDITEFNDMPTKAPLNFAEEVPFIDGTTSIDNYQTYSELAVIETDIPWAPFLNNQEFAKFAILDFDTDNPRVFFINSETHNIHASFLSTINSTIADAVTGEIVYNPNDILPNGVIGSYSFNYSFGDAEPFAHTRKTYELLIANMPYLQNNMKHFIGNGGETSHELFYKEDFVGSRINVVLESQVFSDVDFIPFHEAEGYGYFRHMQLDENPGSRDIVLYDALPNSLPRVGGIITSVVQTPLSHVNLRAIQDNVPNAYIREPLEIDSIANLLNNYIYYKVENDNYYIREATLAEVIAWYENIRPTEPQIPERDLSLTNILPLDSIQFEMSTAFGAKCSNVATMRRFGFPAGTIPNGFGVPFYFYDEFMKFNNFYQAVEDMISDPDFINDLETRIDKLDDFRKEIRDAPMPQWMLDELQAMHESFPSGTSVRCRSSTNNEDLPGFSGAGLYTSKTQHPDEGHISKSIKQVYASMWNFRAYEERDFYRVDQYIAAMGVLCHPNFEDEKSNGVGVSIDPIYSTANTFYLNTQVGENLITNPDPNAVPEEILLYEDANRGYFLLRESNLVLPGELVMDSVYLDLMRDYLKVIHDEFAVLYNVEGVDGFGMDIEYKVTAQDQLVIKQARPWVSFWADIKASFDLAVDEVNNPQNSASLGDDELVTVTIANKGLNDMYDFDISLSIDGQTVETMFITDTIRTQDDTEFQFTTPQNFSVVRDYDISVIVSSTEDGYSGNDTLNVKVSKLHSLEGGIFIEKATPRCENEVDVQAIITNYGAETFDSTLIEVVVNGMAVDTIIYDFNIPYLAELEIDITVTENLLQMDNEITLNLLTVNGQLDAISTNNSASANTDINSNHDYITLVIDVDNYPEETSWILIDALHNEPIASDALENNIISYDIDVCVDYSSCLSLKVLDSYGDGICCGYGIGNFFVLSATGDTLVTNNGEFGHEAIELFCPNKEGCAITADITTTNASNEFATDGTLTISPITGFQPYQYSIDSGLTFVNQNTFTDLAPGNYNIFIKDASETCFYEELVVVNYDSTSSVDNIELGGINIFPNPTQGDVVIEINQSANLYDTVQIEIYDCLGRLIQTDFISASSGRNKTILSLEDYTSGVYFIKCYNQQFEKSFMVSKI